LQLLVNKVIGMNKFPFSLQISLKEVLPYCQCGLRTAYVPGRLEPLLTNWQVEDVHIVR
jgi:hypothetical protein